MGVDVCTYRARIGTFFLRQRSGCRLLESFSACSCLLRFLCPRASLVLATCLALVLLCAGDVESNPGPKIEDVLTLLKQQHIETTSVLAELKQNVANINAKISSIEQTISTFPQFTDHVGAVNDSVRQTKLSIQKTSEELVNVVDDVNNRMRRNNLIVKGLPEVEKEDYNESEKIVRNFFTTHLKLNIGEIERAHRVGQPRPNFQRPIIVKFLNFKSKSEALSNASKLKDIDSPKVWLEEDFSPRIQFARKKLREFAKTNREANERFQVRFNSLHFRGCIFRYDAATDSVLQVSTRKEQPVK